MKATLIVLLLFTFGCEPPTAVRPTTSESGVPPGGVRKIVSGSAHSCALIAGGTVVCWGSTGSQQLGLKADGKPIQSSIPVVIHNISDAVDITAGANHTCVLHERGEITCFGDDGANDGVWEVKVDDARRLASAGGTTCAIASSDVFCWGRNTKGQIPLVGDARVTAPQPIGIAGALELVGGGDAFAVRTEKGWVSWGGNQTNLLARKEGAKKAPIAPFQPPALKGLALGGAFACGAGPSETVCWGELGKVEGEDPKKATLEDVAETEVVSKRKVEGLGTVEKLALGKTHGCALAGGKTLCWGENAQGALGDGTTKHRAEAKPVPNLANLTDISVGTFFSCATDAKTIWCWGNNDFGQVGVDGRASRLEPTPILFPGS